MVTNNFHASSLVFTTGSLSQPTALVWGPDGRLYVTEVDGDVKVFTVAFGDPDPTDGDNTAQFHVTDMQVLGQVKAIQNHNDNGTLNGTLKRQVTGIDVTQQFDSNGNPVMIDGKPAVTIYVTSSDSRVGAGGNGNDVNLDTNSGVITKLTQTGANSWDAVDIVRGFGRSEENHALNGLEVVQEVDGDGKLVSERMIVAAGGNTNTGAPSNNFAGQAEQPLSGAILEIDLDMLKEMTIKADPVTGRKYIYDLPTLNDPTRPGTSDNNDPFGGNDGFNSAKFLADGPVRMYSPGYRNAYDVEVTEDGRVFTYDNGANNSWGGRPVGEAGDNGGAIDFAQALKYIATNLNNGDANTNDDINLLPWDPSNKDQLHEITRSDDLGNRELSAGQGGAHTYEMGGLTYVYGGHPNPTRAEGSRAGLLFTPDAGTDNAFLLVSDQDSFGNGGGSDYDEVVAWLTEVENDNAKYPSSGIFGAGPGALTKKVLAVTPGVLYDIYSFSDGSGIAVAKDGPVPSKVINGVSQTGTLLGTTGLPEDIADIVHTPNPIEGNYLEAGKTDGALDSGFGSINGLTEYTSTILDGNGVKMSGALIAAQLNGGSLIVMGRGSDGVMDSTVSGGFSVAADRTIIKSGGGPLGIATLGDNHEELGLGKAFQGTIWTAVYSQNGPLIEIFQPNNGAVPLAGQELVNPTDRDGDGISHLDDPFEFSAVNGYALSAGQTLTIDFNPQGSTFPNSISSTGLLGAALDGETPNRDAQTEAEGFPADQQQDGLFNLGSNVLPGGNAPILQIKNVAAGTVVGTGNTARDVLHTGIRPSPDVKRLMITVEAKNWIPVQATGLKAGQLTGLIFGDGTQSNFLRFVFGSVNGGPGFEIGYELGDANYTVLAQVPVLALADADVSSLQLQLGIDMQDGFAVTAAFKLEGDDGFTSIPLNGFTLPDGVLQDVLTGAHTIGTGAGAKPSGAAVGFLAETAPGVPLAAIDFDGVSIQAFGNEIPADTAAEVGQTGSAGVDTVVYTGTAANLAPLAANVENFDGSGSSAAFSLTANDLNNTIIVGSGQNTLTTGAGADIIKGTLQSLAGDTITDFSLNDTVVVQGATVGGLQVTYAAGSAIVTLNGTTSIVFDGPEFDEFDPETGGELFTFTQTQEGVAITFTPEETVVYRVNAGGGTIAATDGGPAWLGDATLYNATGPVSRTGTSGGTYTDPLTDSQAEVDLSNVDGSAVPWELFITERNDTVKNTATLNYNFAVEEGKAYKITLYYSENWSGIFGYAESNGGKTRQFDVSVEGSVPAAFANINPVAEAAAYLGQPLPSGSASDAVKDAFLGVAFQRSFIYTAKDDVLTLSFLHDLENPKINGIQISQLSTVPALDDQPPAIVSLSVAVLQGQQDGPRTATLVLSDAGGFAQSTFQGLDGTELVFSGIVPGSVSAPTVAISADGKTATLTYTLLPPTDTNAWPAGPGSIGVATGAFTDAAGNGSLGGFTASVVYKALPADDLPLQIPEAGALVDLDFETPGTPLAEGGFDGLFGGPLAADGSVTPIIQDGRLVIPTSQGDLSQGGAVGGPNSKNAFFKEVDLSDPALNEIYITTRFANPFTPEMLAARGITNGIIPNFAQQGIIIGTGTQGSDEFVKLVFGGNFGNGVQMWSKGSVSQLYYLDLMTPGEQTLADVATVELSLRIDKAAGTIAQIVTLYDENGLIIGGVRPEPTSGFATSTPQPIPAAVLANILSASETTKIGVVSTDFDQPSQPFASFDATWDFLRVSAVGYTPVPEPVPVRIEAEAFTLESGFTVENQAAASDDIPGGGGKVIRLPDGNSTGSASFTVGDGVVSGTYDISITYFDENDGVSTAKLYAGDGTLLVGIWSFDDPGSTGGAGADGLRTVTFSGVNITSGTVLRLEAQSQAAEYARIDFVELIPSKPDANTAPTILTPIQDVTLALGAAETLSVVANFTDADGDALTYSVDPDSLPPGLTFANGVFSGAATQAGTWSVQVTASDGKASVTDTLVFTVPAGPSPVKIEAEAMTLTGGFTVENAAAASDEIPGGGGKVIRLPTGSSTGSASLTVGNGIPAGTYTVKITYFDENDGVSSASLFAGDGTSLVGTWTFDDPGSSSGATADNLRTVSFGGVTIGEGTVLRLEAQSQGAEYARIDYIELVPSAAPAPDALAPTGDLDQDGQMNNADADIDGDLTPNSTDVFYYDAANGQPLADGAAVLLDFAVSGTPFQAGFTGVMQGTTADTAYVKETGAGSVAGGQLLVQTTSGDTGGSNNPQNDYHFGIRRGGGFTVETVMVNPFKAGFPGSFAQAGISVGLNSLDFVKLVIGSGASADMEFSTRINDVEIKAPVGAGFPNGLTYAGFDKAKLEIEITLDAQGNAAAIGRVTLLDAADQPLVGVPVSSFTLDLGGALEQALADPAQAVAVGVTSTNGAAPSFQVAYDYLKVTADGEPVVPNAPTDIQLSASTVAENAAGAVIGTLTVTDPDGDAPAWTVSDNRFEVVDGQLKLKPGIALDFEQAGSVALQITATDDDGSLTKDVTITVQNNPADDDQVGQQVLDGLDGVTRGDSYAPGTVGAAVLKIVPGNNNIQQSNFSPNSFQLENTGDKKIAAVFIDVRGALYGDSVFDDDGSGGDHVAKQFGYTADSDASAIPFTSYDYLYLPARTGADPLFASDMQDSGKGADGGWRGIALKFSDQDNGFAKGEKVFFAGDMDPNSIAGLLKATVDTGSAPAWDVGGVSGAELIGSTVTIMFSDGTYASGQLFSDGSQAGSQALITQAIDPATAPVAGLVVNGVSDGGTGSYGGSVPSVLVTGPAGATVRVVMTKGFDPVGNTKAVGGTTVDQLVSDRLAGYDFKVNNAAEFQHIDVTIPASGSIDVGALFAYGNAPNGNADIPNLDKLQLGFTAVVVDAANKLPVGPVSDPVILTNNGQAVSGGAATPPNLAITSPGPQQGHFAPVVSGSNTHFKVQFEDANVAGSDPGGLWSYQTAPDLQGRQSGFQGTGYYLWGNNTNGTVNGPQPDSFLTYTIMVPEGQGGDYTLRLRASRDGELPSGLQNDIWVKINSDAEALQVTKVDSVSSNGFVKLYGGTNDGQWSNAGMIDSVDGAGPNFAAVFTLQPGLNTITFAGRSQGFHVDFWELFKGAAPSLTAANSPFVAAGPTPPVLATPLMDVTLASGQGGTVTLPPGAFVDADGDTLTFSAAIPNAISGLVSFNPAAKQFTVAPGTPAGTYALVVTAQDDDGNLVSDSFNLTVSGAPGVGGDPLTFKVLAGGTLVDADLKDADVLTAGQLTGTVLFSGTLAQGTAGSVLLQLLNGNGQAVASRMEGASPYDIALSSQNLPAGAYTLKATVFSGGNGTGAILGTQETTFSIAPAAPVAIDPLVFKVLAGGALVDADLVDADALAAGQLSGTVLFSGSLKQGTAGSVVLQILDAGGTTVASRTEGAAPYDIALSSQNLPAGAYTLKATVHGGKNGTGAVLGTQETSFSVAAGAPPAGNGATIVASVAGPLADIEQGFSATSPDLEIGSKTVGLQFTIPAGTDLAAGAVVDSATITWVSERTHSNSAVLTFAVENTLNGAPFGSITGRSFLPETEVWQTSGTWQDGQTITAGVDLANQINALVAQDGLQGGDVVTVMVTGSGGTRFVEAAGSGTAATLTLKVAPAMAGFALDGGDRFSFDTLMPPQPDEDAGGPGAVNPAGALEAAWQPDPAHPAHDALIGVTDLDSDLLGLIRYVEVA